MRYLAFLWEYYGIPQYTALFKIYRYYTEYIYPVYFPYTGIRRPYKSDHFYVMRQLVVE
jgi:hypothetical protein